MAVISTGNHPKALWPGVYAWFGQKYGEHDREYTSLFDIKTSDQSHEELAETTSFGLVPVKNEGASTTYDTHSQGVTSRYVNVAYSLGYIVTREELADNKYLSSSMDRSGALAFGLRQTEENVGAQIYNRAFNSSFTGADGVQLIASTHPAAAGGNQSNVLATAADFNELALEDMLIQIGQAKNNRGLRVKLLPQTLAGPLNLMFEFERVLTSVGQNDTANNAPNAVKQMGMVPKRQISHYFTDTDAWFIRTDAPNGLIWFNREGADFKQDSDFDTDNAKAKVYRRFSVGWTDWRGIYGTPGA